MDGYLEPCGCTQGQQGGLIRRLDFVDRLRAENWPMALIDLGGLVKDPTAARGGFDQAKIKFGIALKAYQTLGYQAIALSARGLESRESARPSASSSATSANPPRSSWPMFSPARGMSRISSPAA